MKNFAELDLIKPLQRAIDGEGYETPTPIQAQTIPPALEGRDVLGCAQTGTGKTAAFALPILDFLGDQKPKPEPRKPIALILAPTRELAIQIDDSFATYGKHLKIRRALVYGGVGQSKQVNAMKQGVHVLVATPGRLLDLMEQGHIKLDQLEVFVLDEADRMLDMGFLPDLKRIIKHLPKDRQSLFFSATMPPKIVALSKQLLVKPVNVNVTPKETSVDKIKQKVMFVDRGGAKQDLLTRILSTKDVERAIVFTRTKRGANQVAKKLLSAGIEAVPIHGNKSQNARQRALEAFRKNRVQVLVATDVAARGIDIDGISHVVNFDMPNEPEAYVHRIGRTGRAGAKGIAISFCTPDEHEELRDIENLIKRKIPASRTQGSQTRESSESQKPASGGRSGGGARRKGPSSGGSNRSSKRPDSRRRKSVSKKLKGSTTIPRKKRSNAVNSVGKKKEGGEGDSMAKKKTANRKRQRPGRNARKKKD